MGDLARPHRLTPRRRLILYLLSARLVICALPFLRFSFCTGRPLLVTQGETLGWRPAAGAGHRFGPSPFPAVEARPYRGEMAGLSNFPPRGVRPAGWARRLVLVKTASAWLARAHDKAQRHIVSGPCFRGDRLPGRGDGVGHRHESDHSRGTGRMAAAVAGGAGGSGAGLGVGEAVGPGLAVTGGGLA